MRPDIAIIGGGVIGCAVAYVLARAGITGILVLERAEPGGEASSAAAGILTVASSRAPGGALFELRRRSAALFPGLVEELAGRTGIDVEYRLAGLLELAFDDGEADGLQGLAERRRGQGFAVTMLDADGVRALEPEVSPATVAGALFADDHSIDNRRFVAALRSGAERRGVTFRFGAPVTAVETAGGRVVAMLAGGERVVPGQVVVAAGVGSRAVGALLGVRVPVRPDKGEMLALRGPAVLQHAVMWGKGYLVPRNDGEIFVGSTSVRGAEDTEVTAEAQTLLMERARRMMPALHDARRLRHWAGLRPCPTIRRPIIGPVPGFDNLLLATGHHRSGILLAPITAQLIRDIILGRPPEVPLAPFCYKPR